MSDPFLIGDCMTGGYSKGPDILHECTIAVEKGEIAVIVGPNGAGKSTAMKAVFGMLDVRQVPCVCKAKISQNYPPRPRVKGDGICATNPQYLYLNDGRRKPRNGRVYSDR